ncbi:MAG: hypothetical protein Q8P72_06510 [Candidatus Roizmanbacteria bacterium]|nr:hypothetical protein [Candidatus Roizmanbacteria bacterium]
MLTKNMISKKFSNIIKRTSIFLLALVYFAQSSGIVYAATSWTQTDWSSGVGASTTNQYLSGSSIDATTTSGQVVLSRTEKLTNTGFATDNSSWSTAAVPPSGWVEVPVNATYNPPTGNFLAMQYEAKYDCTATPDGIGDTAATWI